jgi:pimeloyl-ACP methyl ester carboxylesterase
MWVGIWPELIKQRTALRLDLRGFGDSDTPPQDGSVDHVADVVSSLSEAGITRCHLVGSSFGAGVATEVALSVPELAESLLLCPPGGSLLAWLSDDLRRFFQTESAALDGGDVEAAVSANVDAWVVGSGRHHADVSPDVIAAVDVMQRRAFEIQRGWEDSGHSVRTVEADPEPYQHYGDVAPRTMTLYGQHDMDTVKEAAERVVAGIEDADGVCWDRAAHLPSMERPADFLTVLLEWTDRP